MAEVILIKGMEMPYCCTDCRFMADGWCYAISTDDKQPAEASMKRPNWCPLIELPPHGNLIDLDDYVKTINDRIDAAIKWGINAIADGNQEIKTRAEQAVATFCEASLTARKMPIIIEAEGVSE